MQTEGQQYLLEMSIARQQLEEALDTCHDLKGVVTADTIDDLHRGWKDKIQRLSHGTGSGNADDSDSSTPLWNLIHHLVLCLKSIETAAALIESLQTAEENAIEILSLQQQALVQACFDLVLGYASRCLLPSGVQAPGREPPRLNPSVNQIYSLERDQLTIESVSLRLTSLVSLLIKYNTSKATIFQRFPLQCPNLIAVVTYFLYLERRVVTPLVSHLQRWWAHRLFFTLPSEHGFRLLVFYSVNKVCPALRIAAIFGIRELLIPPGNLRRLLQADVSESTWQGDSEVYQQITSAVVGDATDSDLFSRLAADLKQIINCERSTVPMKRVVLAMALTMSTFQPQLMSLFIWTELFKPLSFVLRPSTPSTKLRDVLNLLPIYSWLLEVPSLSVSCLLAFRPNWFGLAVIYASVAAYLQRPVLENPEFLEEVKSELGAFLIRVVSTFAKLQPQSLETETKPGKRKLAEFVISLVIGSRKVNRLGVRVELLPSYEKGEEVLDSFRLTPPLQLETKEIVASASKHIFQLLSNDLEEKLVKLLFAQLLQFEGRSLDIYPDVELRIVETIKVSTVENLSHYLSAQAFVATVMLGEMGSSESSFEHLLQGIEQDENAFTFLTFVTKKLETDLSDWIAANRDRVAASEFPFSVTLVQTLEIVELLCESTYEDEVSPRKRESQTSDALLKESLQGWANLNQLVPFLSTVASLEHTMLTQTGIRARAEELLVFIQTRGRGGYKRGPVTSTPREKGFHGSVCTVEQALFALNSAAPSTVGMGLMQMKKLIEERDLGVDTHMQVIMKRLLEILGSDDEYIYNHCIKALVALALEKHDMILQVLSQYAPSALNAGSMSEADLQYRLKLGEVLCKTFGSLGAVSAKYLSPVLSAAQRATQRYDSAQLKVSAHQVLVSILPSMVSSLECDIVHIWTWLEPRLDESDEQVQISGWVLVRTLFECLTKVAEQGGSVGSNTSFFAKSASSRVRQELIGECEQVRSARESAASEAQQFAVKLLEDPLCNQFRGIKIL